MNMFINKSKVYSAMRMLEPRVLDIFLCIFDDYLMKALDINRGTGVFTL